MSSLILTEVEGKELLKRAGLQVPRGVLIHTADELNLISEKNLSLPLYLKAQVLHGNRELQNMIRKANDEAELRAIAAELLSSTDQYNQPVQAVLVEETINFDREMYLSLAYDTNSRQLTARFSFTGGVGMDDRGETISTLPLSILEEPKIFPAEHGLLTTVQNLWHLVKDHDAILVEINPIVKKDNQYICLDAKIELETAARFRHQEWERYPERSPLGRPPTEREMRAKEVSAMDHRGAAGESFFEFIAGEVGVLASGGGASQLAMDALLAAGISPANYTEYSGNPPREKVKALTDIVLSIPNLKGLYVVGSNANFTDIFETLAGLIDSLLESPYKDDSNFNLLIRRGGPRWQEAFAMVEERLQTTKIKFKLFGPDFPVVETAAVMKQMIENGHSH